jgi:serine/threonine protein phosphatase PrpC
MAAGWCQFIRVAPISSLMCSAFAHPHTQHTIAPLISSLQLAAKDQIITAEPDVLSQQLTAEDTFLVLACDGIWDVMTK